MLSGSKSMVLNIVHRIPPVAAGQTRPLKISGMIDYAAFTTDPCEHGGCAYSAYMIVLRPPVESFIHSSQFQYVELQNPNVFFVTEAKQEGELLAGHIPQAVSGMYAAAKHLKYDPVFCPRLSLMLSHIRLGNGFSAALSRMDINGCF